jgi:hypothetical protein
MEGSAGIERDGTRAVLNADEVGRRGGVHPPYDRGGVKLSQAVITQTRDGNWKMFIQSDKQVEMMIEVDSLEDIIKELRFAASREWEQRS